MQTVLIDYGSGNLHSAEKAFQKVAAHTNRGRVVVTSDPDTVARADRIVLPGDGAFPACRRGLAGLDGLENALREAVETRGRPFLGICVGMQMMATVGYEHESTPGFGWIDGQVVAIDPGDPRLKVPHMGWNDLIVTAPSHPVLKGIETGQHAYFVHSYHMQTSTPLDCLAHVHHGGAISAIVGRGCRVGTQFHPEKSQATGLRLIENFLDWAP